MNFRFFKIQEKKIKLYIAFNFTPLDLSMDMDATNWNSFFTLT